MSEERDIVWFTHPEQEEPGFVANQHLITSVRVKRGPGHDVLRIWNRGGCAGELTVNREDGEEIARRLIGPNYRRVARREVPTWEV